MTLKYISLGFFTLSGLLHILFFVIESILFQKPEGYKYFKMSEQDHRGAKLWALNQGFYNLFFAFGMLAGIFFEQQSLILFCALSMIGAGIVLWVTAPRLLKGALIQLVPPLVGLIFLFLPTSGSAQ
jgi:putative membrane protein